MNANRLYEFSTGIRPQRNPDGGWVSLGFTGQYMNVIGSIPHPIKRSIANEAFEGAFSEQPAMIGRVVQVSQDFAYSVVAIVSRGWDDRGRRIVCYRYLWCEVNDGLSRLLAWIDNYKREHDGQLPIFNPFEKVVEKDPYLPNNITKKEPPSEFLANSVPILIKPNQPYTLEKIHALASAKASGQPVTWAYNVEALKHPRSFIVIQAANDHAYEFWQRVIANPPEVQTPMVGDEQELNSAINSLINSSTVRPKAVGKILIAIENKKITEEYWHSLFDSLGAKYALNRNKIYTPQIVRLLTLRTLIIPETLPVYLDWLFNKNRDKRDVNQFLKNISQINPLLNSILQSLTEKDDFKDSSDYLEWLQLKKNLNEYEFNQLLRDFITQVNYQPNSQLSSTLENLTLIYNTGNLPKYLEWLQLKKNLNEYEFNQLLKKIKLFKNIKPSLAQAIIFPINNKKLFFLIVIIEVLAAIVYGVVTLILTNSSNILDVDFLLKVQFASQMVILTATICIIPTVAPWLIRKLTRNKSKPTHVLLETLMFLTLIFGFSLWLFGTSILGSWIISVIILILLLEIGSHLIRHYQVEPIEALQKYLDKQKLFCLTKEEKAIVEDTRKYIKTMFDRQVYLSRFVVIGMSIGTISGLYNNNTFKHTVVLCLQLIFLLDSLVLVCFIIFYSFDEMSSSLLKNILKKYDMNYEINSEQQAIQITKAITNLRKIYLYDSLHNVVLLIGFITVLIYLWNLKINILWLIGSLILAILILNILPYTIGQNVLHKEINEYYIRKKEQTKIGKTLRKNAPLFPEEIIKIMAALKTMAAALKTIAKEIIKIMAEKKTTNYYNMSKGNVSITSGDSSKISGVTAAGKNMTTTGSAIGDTSGTVTATINQLPSSTDPNEPGIKELLAELQAAIADETSLEDEDKAEALKQVRTLAEAGQNPNDGVMKKAAKTAMKILRGTATSLPTATKLVEEFNKLLPAIDKIFGL